MRGGQSVLKEMRNEAIVKVGAILGTALATVAAGVSLYNVVTKEPKVANDKAPTTPAVEQPVAPAPFTKGDAFAERGK